MRERKKEREREKDKEINRQIEIQKGNQRGFLLYFIRGKTESCFCAPLLPEMEPVVGTAGLKTKGQAGQQAGRPSRAGDSPCPAADQEGQAENN